MIKLLFNLFFWVHIFAQHTNIVFFFILFLHKKWKGFPKVHPKSKTNLKEIYIFRYRKRLILIRFQQLQALLNHFGQSVFHLYPRLHNLLLAEFCINQSDYCTWIIYRWYSSYDIHFNVKKLPNTNYPKCVENDICNKGSIHLKKKIVNFYNLGGRGWGGSSQYFYIFTTFFLACSNSSKSAIKFFFKGGRGTPWPIDLKI